MLDFVVVYVHVCWILLCDCMCVGICCCVSACVVVCVHVCRSLFLYM